MNTNKYNFLKLVSEDSHETLEKIKWRNANKFSLKEHNMKTKKFFKRSARNPLYFIIKSFIKIGDAITPLMTLGLYWTDLEYTFTKWVNFNQKFKKIQWKKKETDCISN